MVERVASKNYARGVKSGGVKSAKSAGPGSDHEMSDTDNNIKNDTPPDMSDEE